MAVTIESSTDNPEDVKAALEADAKDRGVSLTVTEEKPSTEPDPDAVEPKAKGHEAVTEAEDARERDEKGRFSSTREESTESKADDDDQEDEDEEPKGKGIKSLQRRLNKATRQRYEMEARAEAAENENSELKSRLDAIEAKLGGAGKAGDDSEPAKKAEEAAKKPDRDDFDDFDDYIDALTDWKIDQRGATKDSLREQIRAELEAEKAEEVKEAAREEGKRMVEAYQERYQAASEAIEDFDSVLKESADLPMSDTMKEVVVTSENGPLLLYLLCHNPELCEEIADMSPARAAAALGRLEARLEAEGSGAAETLEEDSENTPRERQSLVSRAPKPITPVGGRASTSTVPDEKRPFREWADERNEAEFKQMQRGL